jgi:hypothetical protein
MGPSTRTPRIYQKSTWSKAHKVPIFTKLEIASLYKGKSGGREGIRTPGLLVANEALSQLSYSPTSSNL